MLEIVGQWQPQWGTNDGGSTLAVNDGTEVSVLFNGANEAHNVASLLKMATAVNTDTKGMGISMIEANMKVISVQELNESVSFKNIETSNDIKTIPILIKNCIFPLDLIFT